jgi:hypothetical protein
MSAKFTKGDSIRSTRTITPMRRVASEPKTHSVDGPRSGNTMNGMPGYINAHQTESMDHARGGKGFGPHREGPVGKRGSSGAKSMGKSGNATGTTVKNYKSASTDSAGSLHGNSNTGGHHVHTKSRGGPMPGQKPPPTSKGILGGTVRRAGLDVKRNERSSGFQATIGHAGRMEKLAGRAKTSYEGRRKSSMY